MGAWGSRSGVIKRAHARGSCCRCKGPGHGEGERAAALVALAPAAPLNRIRHDTPQTCSGRRGMGSPQARAGPPYSASFGGCCPTPSRLSQAFYVAWYVATCPWQVMPPRPGAHGGLSAVPAVQFAGRRRPAWTRCCVRPAWWKKACCLFMPYVSAISCVWQLGWKRRSL